MKRTALCRIAVVLLVLAVPLPQFAQSRTSNRNNGYHKPPKVITDVLESPAQPQVSVSPTDDRLLVILGQRHPSIADLAQPMLRLAGHRINPATNGVHHPPRVTALEMVDIGTGKSRKVTTPAGAYLSRPVWSPDGKQFAFTNTTANAIELWIGDAATGSARKLNTAPLNGAYGTAFRWTPDSKSLLVQLVPAGRGKPPQPPAVPDGPIVQESYGKAAPAATYEDLLTSPYDEDLWDYYATSQLALVDAQRGRATNVGKAAVIASAEPSPDGKYFLVVRNVRPYSYILPSFGFPKEVEVWTRAGDLAYKVASLPSQEGVPIEGVSTGPRSYGWRATEPATLTWVEALDGGNTLKPAPLRDKIVMLRAPFIQQGKQQPTEIIKLEQRFQAAGGGFGPGGGRGGNGIEWLESGGTALVRDYDRRKRWARTFLVNFDDPAQQPKLIWSRSVQDRYGDPGLPVLRELPNGFRAVMQDGDSIFLIGQGASDAGDRPFLDRFDLATGKAERVFRSSEKSFEEPIAVLGGKGAQFLTRYESPTEQPNYFVRSAANNERRQLTQFPDPAPQLRGITRQLVTYKRDDGVPLSFELYLPAGYKPGTPLPTIVWAYPREFNDASTAGQVTGSPNRFTVINGMSELWLLTQGYAILDNASMPVVGDPDTMNNTYVEQVVASAKAAIDKAVDMGVTDRNRVGVGGHSYGAFMTANLLAHSDLFRAGVARSGAYNRTLTPFGFQSERRTFWQAEDVYMKMSPFAFANKFHAPILLIHGMADDNSGTFPIQSERLYQAIKGNGGNVRYVQLPYEAHGYQALESVEDVLYEMITWFDKYVKNAPPAGGGPVSASK
jgi:dipeptidyl aminopeptidase/acylaminoacyl peptidase